MPSTSTGKPSMNHSEINDEGERDFNPNIFEMEAGSIKFLFF